MYNVLIQYKLLIDEIDNGDDAIFQIEKVSQFEQFILYSYPIRLVSEFGIKHCKIFYTYLIHIRSDEFIHERLSWCLTEQKQPVGASAMVTHHACMRPDQCYRKKFKLYSLKYHQSRNNPLNYLLVQFP